jgi:nucleoid DNA-binding protein
MSHLEKVSFATLVREIGRMTGVPQSDVDSVLRAFMDTVKMHLRKGRVVSLPRFGKFRVSKWMNKRRIGFTAYVRNPKANIEMNNGRKT